MAWSGLTEDVAAFVTNCQSSSPYKRNTQSISSLLPLFTQNTRPTSPSAHLWLSSLSSGSWLSNPHQVTDAVAPSARQTRSKGLLLERNKTGLRNKRATVLKTSASGKQWWWTSRKSNLALDLNQAISPICMLLLTKAGFGAPEVTQCY